MSNYETLSERAVLRFIHNLTICARLVIDSDVDTAMKVKSMHAVSELTHLAAGIGASLDHWRQTVPGFVRAMTEREKEIGTTNLIPRCSNEVFGG